MAGFQALGITSTFPSQQPSSHHFHGHRHQTPQHSSPASSMESVDCLQSSSSSKTRSFSSVGASAVDRFPHPVEDGPRRRHSEDSSSYLRSEWVTLSKAMLMVLVEKICQLSFENEASSPTTTTIVGTSPSHAPVSDNPDAADALMMPQSQNLQSRQHGSGTPDPTGSSSLVPALAPDLASLACFGGPSLAHAVPASLAFVPESSALAASPGAPTLERMPHHESALAHDNSSHVKTNVTSKKSRASSNAENSWNATETGGIALPLEERPRGPGSASLTATLGRKRSSKRSHLKLTRAGKHEKSREGGQTSVDEKMRKLRLRPLRQRNSNRCMQSWIACNKTLVYSMIDSALAASDTATQQQVVIVPSNVNAAAVEKEIQSVRCHDVRKSGNESDDATVQDTDARIGDDEAGATGAMDLCLTGTEASAMPDKTTKQPFLLHGANPVCETPLLGALLSYDDISDVNNDVQTPAALGSRRQHHHHHLPRSDCPSNVRPMPPACVGRVGAGVGWHRASPTEHQATNPPKPNRRFYGYAPFASPLGLTRPSAQVFVTGRPDFVGGRFFDASLERHSPRSLVGCGAVGPRFEGTNCRRSVEERGGGGSCPGRRRERLGSDEARSHDLRQSVTDGMASVGPEVDRPRWIALDKSEVRSLVDSLVSTMMTGEDATQTSAAKCTSTASPSNAAIFNSTDGNRLLDTDASHRPDDNGGDKVVMETTGVRYSENACDDHLRSDVRNSGHHGSALDSRRNGRHGRHGDNARGCWQKQDIQCLPVDDAKGCASKGTAQPDSVTKETENKRSRESKASGNASKCTMKWKSTMIVRLHSQSQDEEQAPT